MATKRTAKNTNGMVYLPTEYLHPHPENPRGDLGDITELADSIKKQGILQNLTVIADKDSDGNIKENSYTVVIGHRRCAAAKLAGVEKVPCIIAEMSHEDQIATMLLENIQRSDLTVYEQAYGFQTMLDMGFTVDKLAEKTGFSKSTIRRRTKLAELDRDKLKKAADKQVTLADFDKLNEIEDIQTRNKLLERIGTSNYNYEVQGAINQQRRDKSEGLWRNFLSGKGASEIDKSDFYTAKYKTVCTVHIGDDCLSDKDMEKLLLDNFPAFDTGTKYCYHLSYGYLYIKTFDKNFDKNNAKKQEERAKQEALRKEKKAALNTALECAYDLRRNFIKNLSSTDAKACLQKAVKYLFWLLITEKINIYDSDEHIKICADIFGIDGIDLETADYEEILEKGAEHINKNAERGLVQTVYGIIEEGPDMHTYDYSLTYSENSRLSLLYEYLADIGYEISDEEKALLDGTSELYSV